ncbi:MAG: hypothetical protein WCI36_04490 [bacterium]
MKKIKFIAILNIIIFGVVVISKNSLAQDVQDVPKGFSMSPFFQEVNLAKDQNSSSFALEISNNTPESAVLKLSVVDFGALDETGGVAFLGSAEDLKNKYSLASWVSLEKDAVVLEAGEKQSVKVTIENKDSLSPGGHYAAVMAKMEKDNNGTGSESSIVAVDPSFASLVFVRKISGEIFGLNLKSIEKSDSTFSLAKTSHLRFQNTGNVHVTPRGIVKVVDPIGREVSRGIINEESSLVLPETFRVLPVTLKDVAIAFVPGKYTTNVEYRFDGKDDFEVIQQSSYFFPIKIILIIIVAMLLVMLGWKKFAKRISQKQNETKQNKKGSKK